jgi:GNAT superfamily N-acetyltransferase
MAISDGSSLAPVARRWMHSTQRATCDVERTWQHGRVFRATRYPRYFDLNVVVVEDDPGLGVEELIAVADRELGGLVHRRLDFDHVAAAEPLRAGFEARGWKTVRLVWMHHRGPRTGPSTPAVTEVSYDTADPLRAAWHGEDFPGVEDADHLRQRREVSLRRNARVLAAHQDGIAVAFSQLEQEGDEMEITSVYVLPGHRGAGYGTAVTEAAIAVAGEVPHLWICADDEDRPKKLYARLGFAPVLTTVEFTRLP